MIFKVLYSINTQPENQEEKCNVMQELINITLHSLFEVILYVFGLSLFLQTEVMDLVQLMGGRVYLDLNVSVTHLIAGEVGSKKYLVAASLGKPILLPSWIHACWEKSQDRYADTYCFPFSVFLSEQIFST